MPEGPEVRRAADQIQNAIAGQQLKSVEIHALSLRALGNRLDGNTLRKVHTYSKAFVLEFDQDIFIYVHLQLYGKWKTGRVRQAVATKRTLRLRLETETHYAALYSATDIQVIKKENIATHPYIIKLGPDLLSHPTMVASHISRRLAKKQFARRRIGHLLLDQGFFAGIGNYLRSEILFSAKLPPNILLGQLTPTQRRNLARAIYTMIHRAYKKGGVTVTDDLVKAAKAQNQTRSQYRHYVFARESNPCRVCGTTITKTQVSGRRLYLCPHCQS